MTRLRLVVGLLLIGATVSHAQIIYNPRKIAFTSPSHPNDCAVTVNECVTGYLIEVWPEGAAGVGTPFRSGRVAREDVTTSTEPDLTYEMLLVRQVPAWEPVPVGRAYVVTLRAIGYASDVVSERSAPSNPFASPNAPQAPASVSVR